MVNTGTTTTRKSVQAAIHLADEIYELIQADRDKKGTLKEVETKISIVITVLQRIKPDVVILPQEGQILKQIIQTLEQLSEEVTNVQRMKNFVYFLQAKRHQEQLRRTVDTVHFYVNSLHFAQTIDKSKLSLRDDDWSRNPTDRASSLLLQQLQEEQQQTAELRRQIDAKCIEVEQLQRMALLTKVDVQECSGQVEEVQQRFSVHYMNERSKRETEAACLEPMAFAIQEEDQLRLRKEENSIIPSVRSEEAVVTYPPSLPAFPSSVEQKQKDTIILDVIEGGESILQEPIPKTLSDNEVDPSKIKRKGIHPQGSSGESVVENETKLSTRKSILVWSTIVCVFVLVEVVVIAVVLLKPAPLPISASASCYTTLRGATTGDYLGAALVLSSDGTRLVVGGGDRNKHGFVQAFDWTDSSWSPVGETLTGAAAKDYFGFSLALSSDGNRLVVAASHNDNGNGGEDAGLVQIFDWTGNSWSQVGNNLTGIAAHDYFGFSLALSSDGTRLAVGAHWNDDDESGDNAGLVQVIDLTGSSWSQVGNDLTGIANRNWFGSSLAFSSDGTRIAVGAPGHDRDQTGVEAGLVQVFDWTGSAWSQVGNNLTGTGEGDMFGSSVAFSSDGTRLAVGAPGSDDGENGVDAGRVQIFDWTGSSWSQMGKDLIGTVAGDKFGSSLTFSSDGTRLAARAHGNDDDNFSGYVQVLNWTGSSWSQVGRVMVGSVTEDYFGVALSFSSDGSRLAVGLPWNSNETGLVQVMDLDSTHCS